MLQRFYDIQSGSVLIDGKQVNEYNLKWLRQHIGVVNQEPVLFHTTIRQNILFGRDLATDEEIHQAAKIANAHDFIMTLPDVSEARDLFTFISSGMILIVEIRDSSWRMWRCTFRRTKTKNW